MLISETGIEDERRTVWFEYVTAQADIAMEAGVPLEGICLYPIVNHPGWDDERACQNGLLSAVAKPPKRDVYQPLATAIEMYSLAHPCSQAK
jgi:hypothetical protein